jgi:outer membrane protein assembly factor BamA
MHRELLFKPGDRLSTSVIDETARNLRALLFLGEIDVRTRQVATDSIDVIVSVRDLYSRALTPLLSGEPGELSYGVVGLDYNLLGSGQVLQVTALHDAVTGNEGEVFYRAPRWFGSRSALTGTARLGGEGFDVSLRATRPFYRLSERWSYWVTTRGTRELVRLYSAQTEAERYEEIGLTRRLG